MKRKNEEEKKKEKRFKNQKEPERRSVYQEMSMPVGYRLKKAFGMMRMNYTGEEFRYNFR